MKIKLKDLYDLIQKEKLKSEEDTRRMMYEEEHIQDLYKKIADLENEVKELGLKVEGLFL